MPDEEKMSYSKFSFAQSVGRRIGTIYPERWLSHHPWGFLRDVQMWHLGTWGGLGSAVLMAALDNLKSLF